MMSGIPDAALGSGAATSYREELESRGRVLLEHVARTPSSLWGAQALLALGAERGRVDEVVRSSVPDSMGAFGTLAAAWLACRWGDDLSDEAENLLKVTLTERVSHRGNTENHWLVHYAVTLVAAERWTDVDTWWNGLSREAIHAEAKRWILGTIDRTARLGHHEYDSPQYHTCHVLSMILLADHAGDAQVRHQAAQMATLFIADLTPQKLAYFRFGKHVSKFNIGGNLIGRQSFPAKLKQLRTADTPDILF